MCPHQTTQETVAVKKLNLKGNISFQIHLTELYIFFYLNIKITSKSSYYNYRKTSRVGMQAGEIHIKV